MRYIESATVAQVAEELGVSERQARRDNHEAVDAIAELLRQRLGSEARSDLLPPAASAKPATTTLRSDVGLEKEVARLGSIEPRGPTRLEEVVEGALTTTANLATAKGVSFQVQALSTPVVIAAERTTVRQTILSMIVSAIDLAAPDDRLSLSVRSDAGLAAVEVEIPMPGRVSAESAEVLESRLAIASRLIAPRGGVLDHRRIGSIMRFTLALPTTRITTILLVDDNPGMLRLLKRYLGGGEYTVVEAGNPEEALNLAQVLQPDAITLDVMMPSKDGWEVLQTLRASPRTRHIPVLVCSVLKERDLALSLGAATFLAKPITQSALLRALAKLGISPMR